MFTKSLLGGIIKLTTAPAPLEFTEKTDKARIKAISILKESDNTAGTPVNIDYLEEIFKDVAIFYNYDEYRNMFTNCESIIISNFLDNCDSDCGYLVKDDDVR